MKFKYLLNKLWLQDPGYFRLKRACKTVIAILTIGILSFHAPLLVKFFAAITAGFSMQAIVGETRRKQIYFILVAFPLYFACFALGYVSKNSVLLSSGVLVVLGFLAIYLKQFGPKFNFAPIIGWSFAFFGIILPITGGTLGLIFASLAFGFVISGLVYLFIFPELTDKLFYTNINKFFKEYALVLQWLAQVLIHKVNFDNFHSEKEMNKDYLFRLTLINGDITQSNNESPNINIVQMYKIYIKQYALAKIMSLIFEAFETLIQQKITVYDTIHSHLFTVFAVYATAISNIKIEHDYSNYQDIINTLSIMEQNLADFQQLLLNSIITEKKPFIAIVNLHLGLRLILKNIKQLEHIYES